MTGPLDGVRVIEVANWLAAPGAAVMMADMGADVVKVEPPTGDFYRGHLASQRGDGRNFNFEFENRGKRSIVLDLTRPGASEVVKRLCEDADVFVTNLVPERVERYALGFEELRSRNQRLVYASITGYGARGPEANKPGFDASSFWARSGIMGMIGDPEAAPTVNRGGQGDHTTTLAALAAILAALRQRDQTGEAQFVDVALLRAGVWTLAGDIQQQLGGMPARPRQDRTQQGIVTWNSYRTRDDRWLMLVMVNPERYWNRFARCLEREDLVDDPRFMTSDAMVEHGAALIPELDAIFARRDLAEWGARLDEYGLLWATVATVPEVIADPQLAAYHAFPMVTAEDGSSYQVIGTPFEIVGAEVRPRGPAPSIGQHTAEVLGEHGFSEDELAALGAERVFG